MRIFSRREKTNRRTREPRAGLRGARRFAGRAVLTGGTLAAVVAGWIWLTRTDAFAVKNVAIEGVAAERADEIRALLAINPGHTSLLFLDLADARSKVEAHPWVAKAFVKRELPDTLRIVVQEREPKLILALDRLYYVDASGQPFKSLQPGERYDLPVLTGLNREDLLERADVARAAITGALDLCIALASKETAGALSLDDVSEIAWDARRGYSALNVRGTELVRFGSGEWADKLARLKEVREQRKNSGDAHTIDLTFASRVLVSR